MSIVRLYEVDTRRSFEIASKPNEVSATRLRGQLVWAALEAERRDPVIEQPLTEAAGANNADWRNGYAMLLHPNDPLNPTLEEAAQIIAGLANDFTANAAYYNSASYNEAEVRKDFIDKLLIALGWDVNHEVQRNPFQQEVKVERAVQVATAQRRADYALSLAPHFDSPVLYVEAKKPSGELATSDNYFQVIRYANQRGHAIGILTDFEQLHVIDCRFHTNIDTATQRGIRKYRYTDLIDQERFTELFYLISRPAIADGSLQRFADSLPKSKGRPGQRAFLPIAHKPLDEQLLETLDGLRQSLARSLKNRNPHLDSHALTESTQRIIDRFVFIRFLEDKLIEPTPIVPRLGNTSDRSAWQDFQRICRHLDKIYNGIVFRFHKSLDAADALAIDEKTFAEVLDTFDFHKSRYLFNDIPLHTLGSIYERFLGNVIVATAKRANLQPKPQVRKAGGVYYTPQYIVDYIVRNTVGKIVDGKTPKQIAKMRFADIACGSGSFLLGAYDYLIRYVTHWYNENPSKAPKSAVVKRDGALYLSLEEKSRILTDNIYGVDIDPQAVEVAQLSLYLKLLEEETTASARQYTLEIDRPLLPALADNIKCGNSLIGTDFYSKQQHDLFDKDKHLRINIFDWQVEFAKILQAGGFDAVIGNPPYVNTRIVFQEQGEDVKRYFATRYVAAHRGYDLYVLFVEKPFDLLKKGGRWGMIIPNKIASLDYAEACRRLLLEKTTIECITDVSELRVFPTASVYPYVVVWKNQPPGADHAISVLHAASEKELFSDESVVHVNQADLSASSGFMIHGTLDVEFRVETQPLSKRARLHSGTTGFAAKQMADALLEKRVARGENFFEFVVSGNIDRYSVSLGRVRFMNRQFTRPLLRANARHLTENKRRLYREQKIIIAGMTKRLEAALDSGGFALGVSVYAAAELLDDARYVLGLLNSKLLSHLFRIRFQAKHLAGNFLAINKGQLARLPIRVIDFTVPDDKSRHDQITELVDRMMALQAQRCKSATDHAAIVLERQIASIDREIDKLVYELYELTNKEILAVESQAIG